MTLTQDKIEIIVKNIRENKEFRRSFIKIANGIVDKIYSLVENANCTCGKAVRGWITDDKNKDSIDALMLEYKTLFDAQVLEQPIMAPTVPSLPIKQQPNTTITVMGDVYEIEPTPNAYKQFIRKSITEKWIYRGINIVTTKNSDGIDVWLVLFY